MSQESEQAAFHEALADDRDDAQTRGVYADWLDEHDQPEAAARLRWWAQVLPYLTKKRGGTGEMSSGLQLARAGVPEWVHRLAITHYARAFGKGDGSHAEDELHALGVPGVTLSNPDTSSQRWAKVAKTFPLEKSYRARHAIQAWQAGKKLGINGGVMKLARTKAPAPSGAIVGGGLATGGTFTPAGQFAARARRRIRDVVMAWLHKRVKLARPKAKGGRGDLTQADLSLDSPLHFDTHAPDEGLPHLPALDDAIRTAKDRNSPDDSASAKKLRERLTIRELRDVEQQLDLPHPLRLSNRAENRARTDNEHVGDLDLDTYYKWANNVARHIQRRGLTDTAIDRLRDHTHLSKAKLAFLTARMSREVGQAKATFADSGGAKKWYGDHVAVAVRHLHDEFHNGTPADDELWGKLNPKTGRVTGGAALTIARLLIAATSGGMKPHENYDTAHAMIAEGRENAKGSANPFKSIPDDQGKDFTAWVDGVADWHAAHKTGVTRADILHPGADLKQRALWFERVVAPLPKTLSSGYGGTNNPARYSGVNARFVTDRTSSHYGAPIWMDKGKQGRRSPYGATVSHPAYRPLSATDKGHLEAPEGHTDYSGWLEENHTGAGQQRNAKLPATDADGRLQAPGWTARNDQVLDGRDKINGVVAYFTDKAGGDERQGLKDAAHFFLNEQPAEKFAEIVSWVKERNAPLAKRIADSANENRGFYFSGQPLPGAFLLGPKFGAFSLNLHLDQPNSGHLGAHLTADLWWSRDWNVLLGTLFGSKEKKGGKRQETPRGKGSSASNPERKVMRKVAQLAAERSGLDNIAQLQAVLWYYEQKKPEWFGVNTSSTSYLDGANAVAARKGRRYVIHPTTGDISVEKA